MRTVLALAPAVVAAVTAAHAADVVVVEGDYLAARTPGEASGTTRFMKNVTDALGRAGVDWEASTDSAVENEAALEGARVAVFPYNGTLPEGELDAIEGFMDAGGKVVFFYTLPSRLFERLGMEVGEYIGGDDGRFRLDTVGFDAPDIVGLPKTMKQGSWNAHAITAREGVARIVGTWINQDGQDTGLAAVALAEQGAFMNHVLLNSGPEATGFLMGIIGHWFPDIWEASFDRALAKSEQFGRFATAAELGESVESLPESRSVRQMTTAMARAERVRDSARALADARKWPEAIDALAPIDGILGDGYAKLFPPREGEMRAVWSHSPFNVKDWDAACRHLKRNGFNAVILNLCNAAIAYYPSKYLRQHPRAEEEGDQILRVLEACRANGIELHVWRVNWNAGGDAERIAEMQRGGIAAMSIDGTPGGWLCASRPENQQHEVDTMLEIVRNYDVDGIHFDYIRYHNSKYCYCDHCRETFEKQLGRKLTTWPADVLEQGETRERWLEFRREQINTVVRRVSEEARALKPGIKISAAVFGEWAASRISIGQDAKLWVDEGWLDFVCPMDYTNSTDYLERLTSAQVEAVRGQCPLYIGIGAWRHESVATLADQIQASRELGADGFVLFSYEAGDTDEFITQIGKGQTRGQTYFPHQAPEASITLPDGEFDHQSYTWEAGAQVAAEVTLTAMTTMPKAARSARAELVLETTEGQRIAKLDSLRTTDEQTVTASFAVPEGRSRVALYGTVSYEDGSKGRFVHRGPRMQGLTDEEAAEIRAANEPPVFSGDGAKVGVTKGYGSEAVLEALAAEAGLDVTPLNRLTPEFLEPCDVVVVNQFRTPGVDLPPESREALVAWVKAGGRALLMHDAVGYRQHPTLFPELGKGVGITDSRDLALFTGDVFRHSYYDHIQLEVNADAIVAASDLPDNGGRPVVAGGEVEAGKVVLNGMVTGLGDGDKSVAPEGPEADLLVLSVKWLAE